MLLKFPQVNPNNTDNNLISFGNVCYAKRNKISITDGKQIGFLTEHSLMFILQGKKYFHFGTKKVTINNNQFILVKRGIYTISEFIPDDGFFEALVIFIPDKFLKSTAFENRKTTKEKNETQFVVAERNSFMNDFIFQYLKYFIGDFDGKEKLLQLKFQELFLLLSNSSAKNDVADFLSSIVNGTNIDIEYIVKTNLLQPLTVADFAKLSMRSLASFKRDFERQFHSSPKHWINQQRIIYANGLLDSTDKTVSEIAYECGFENVSYFIKVFKREFGITPNAKRAKSITI